MGICKLYDFAFCERNPASFTGGMKANETFHPYDALVGMGGIGESEVLRSFILFFE
jgi:hypothetical protein